VLVLELCVRGSHPIFRSPNIGAHHGFSRKTTHDASKSKKNTPAKAHQEDHHIAEGNGNSLTAEPLQISDHERRAKLEALQKARAEKTAHTLEAFAEEEAEEDDDEAVDRQLQTMNQKLLIL
jgi:hypothetical protein